MSDRRRHGGSRSRSVPPFCSDAFNAARLVSLPVELFLLYIFAGAWIYPVFVLTTSGQQYGVGAQGYTTGTTEPTTYQFNYPAPASWPSGLHLPTLLLVHFILAIFLLVHILVLLATVIFGRPARKESRARLMFRPLPLISGLLVAVFSLAVSSVDAAVWAKGQQNGSGDARTGAGYELRPAVLGYFVIIGGLLIGVSWMVNLLWVAGERCRRPRKDHEVEIRGERYVRKTDAGWWDRLMGND
ncbi:hypothetical protein JCM24511_09121 [Saitozyma sp. JCM 24511]|nr:hypothetical protein JCM24511_09121 [Saitozyma sp. JCM 24511]